jgi:hypothetical protein
MGSLPRLLRLRIPVKGVTPLATPPNGRIVLQVTANILPQHLRHQADSQGGG